MIPPPGKANSLWSAEACLREIEKPHEKRGTKVPKSKARTAAIARRRPFVLRLPDQLDACLAAGLSGLDSCLEDELLLAVVVVEDSSRDFRL